MSKQNEMLKELVQVYYDNTIKDLLESKTKLNKLSGNVFSSDDELHANNCEISFQTGREQILERQASLLLKIKNYL